MAVTPTFYSVPQPPLQVPIMGAGGVINQTWAQWFTNLYQRIGAGTAPSITQLQTTVAANSLAIANLNTEFTSLNASISAINTTLLAQAAQIQGLGVGRQL